MAFGTGTVLTTAGKGITTNRIKGSGTEPAYVGIGVGATGAARTAAVGDTALSTAVETRTLGTSTQQTTSVTNDTYQVVGTVTATSTGKLSGNYRPLDLTMSDSATEIKIPLLYTYVLADGICADYWTSQKWPTSPEAIGFEQKFNDWLQTMINNLSIRDREIMGYTY